MAIPPYVSTAAHEDGTTTTMATQFPATHAVTARVLKEKGDPQWQVLGWARDETHAHEHLRKALQRVAPYPEYTQVQIVPATGKTAEEVAR